MNENTASSGAVNLHTGKRSAAQQYLMLDIRTKDGRAFGLPYSYLIAVEFDRTQDADPELRLIFTSHKVAINGRNLRLLYERLLGHRLSQITESDSEFDDEQDEFYISTVNVEWMG